jgi:hypothetical protein
MKSGPVVVDPPIMIRTFLTIALMLIGLTVAASAQKTSAPPPPVPANIPDSLSDIDDSLLVIPQNMLAVNLGGTLADYLSADYFRAIGRNDAIGIYGGYIFRPIGAETVRGTLFGAAYRYYPGDRALWRFFVGPLVNYQQFEITGHENLKSSGVSVGGTVGWQWFPYGHLAVGLGVGLQYVFGGGEITNEAMQRMFGIRPAMTFDLGYGW